MLIKSGRDEHAERSLWFEFAQGMKVTPETVSIHNTEVERLKQEMAFLKELLIEKDKRNDNLKHALLLIKS